MGSIREVMIRPGQDIRQKASAGAAKAARLMAADTKLLKCMVDCRPGNATPLVLKFGVG